MQYIATLYLLQTNFNCLYYRQLKDINQNGTDNANNNITEYFISQTRILRNPLYL